MGQGQEHGNETPRQMDVLTDKQTDRHSEINTPFKYLIGRVGGGGDYKFIMPKDAYGLTWSALYISLIRILEYYEVI